MHECGGLLHSLKLKVPFREKYSMYSAECDLYMCDQVCSPIIYHHIALSHLQTHIITYLGYDITQQKKICRDIGKISIYVLVCSHSFRCLSIQYECIFKILQLRIDNITMKLAQHDGAQHAVTTHKLYLIQSTGREFMKILTQNYLSQFRQTRAQICGFYFLIYFQKPRTNWLVLKIINLIFLLLP